MGLIASLAQLVSIVIIPQIINAYDAKVLSMKTDTVDRVLKVKYYMQEDVVHVGRGAQLANPTPRPVGQRPGLRIARHRQLQY